MENKHFFVKIFQFRIALAEKCRKLFKKNQIADFKHSRKLRVTNNLIPERNTFYVTFLNEKKTIPILQDSPFEKNTFNRFSPIQILQDKFVFIIFFQKSLCE